MPAIITSAAGSALRSACAERVRSLAYSAGSGFGSQNAGPFSSFQISHVRSGLGSVSGWVRANVSQNLPSGP